MLASSEWLVEGRVVKITVVGELTLETLINVINEIDRKLVDGKPPFVNTFIDLTQRTGVHPSVFNVAELAKHIKQSPLSGWVLVIDPNTTAGLKFLGTIGAQLGKQRFRMFNTMDEAVAFLKTVDATMVELL